jgi:multiple sugar transport system ATP-binding protein
LPASLQHLSSDAVYGVRPEHLARSDDGLALTVAVVEPTGAETQVIARHGSQSIVCVFRDAVLPQPGETIRVRPDVSRVHLFSEGDGLRLS